jgi:hypothetical protein
MHSGLWPGRALGAGSCGAPFETIAGALLAGPTGISTDTLEGDVAGRACGSSGVR